MHALNVVKCMRTSDNVCMYVMIDVKRTVVKPVLIFVLCVVIRPTRNYGASVGVPGGGKVNLARLVGPEWCGGENCVVLWPVNTDHNSPLVQSRSEVQSL